MAKVNMRVEWFLWVSKTRKKMARRSKTPVSHRMAMKEAALSWPKEKMKIQNRIRREERRAAKEAQSTKSKPPSAPKEPAN